MRIHVAHSKNRSDRYAILSRNALDILTEYWFAYNRPTGWLFPKQTDPSRPIDTFYICRHMRAHEDSLGWEHRLTCHSFRHAFGTHLYENGADLLTIKNLMGHRSLNSTLLYIHLASYPSRNVISPFDRTGGDFPWVTSRSRRSGSILIRITVSQDISSQKNRRKLPMQSLPANPEDLGVNISTCGECGHMEFHKNSCRNRNCPNCQAVLKEIWVDKRRAEVIDSPYFHVVFTLPHELNPLIYCNQRLLYGLLHKCLRRNTSGTERRSEISWRQARDHPGPPYLEPGTGLPCSYALHPLWRRADS